MRPRHAAAVTAWLAAAALCATGCSLPGLAAEEIPHGGAADGAALRPAAAVAPAEGGRGSGDGRASESGDGRGSGSESGSGDGSGSGSGSGSGDEVAAPDERPRMRRQWDHVAAEADATCREALAQSGTKFIPLPDQGAPDRHGCGIPRAVVVTRGPTGIAYSPPLRIDCSFARRLADVERVIQEEAEAHLGSRVARVVTLGSYACRSVVGRMKGWSPGLSEHAFGNAIDLARFEPMRGRAASVLSHFGKAETREGKFLHTIARRLRREGVVSRVLGPGFDASHRDHLHLDRGTPWWQ